jgi:phage shock protein PspC (stress-responsive transcriptional regulator)
MKKLYRSKTDNKVAGVLGGLGDYLNIDPTILRVIFIVALVATGIFPFAIGYLIAALVIPYKPERGNGSVVDEQ